MTRFSAKSLLAAGLIALGATAAQADRFDGTLNAQWGDPRPGAAGGETRFSVTTPDGKTFALIVSPADQGRAMAAFGRHVVIQGKIVTDAHGQSAIAADRIEATAAAERHGAVETRRVI